MLAAAAESLPADARADAVDLVALVVKNPARNAADQTPVIAKMLPGEIPKKTGTDN